ncbi:GAF domain-containing protein [Streptomyces sp. CS065A]|uniref:GAF domain-containing protein n=1 Tax=unclassified Streptomyces TaxID=2593676 RepID=UPI0031BAD2CD
MSDQEPVSLAPSDPLLVELDQLQHRLGQGPCFNAALHAAKERVFRIADFTQAGSRWPGFVPEVPKLGVGSTMGFLLPTDDDDFGVLDFYSREPGVFTESSETAGVLLVSHAAVALVRAAAVSRPLSRSSAHEYAYSKPSGSPSPPGTSRAGRGGLPFHPPSGGTARF